MGTSEGPGPAAQPAAERAGPGARVRRRARRRGRARQLAGRLDDGIDWIIDQLIEGFLVSANVEEVFADDPTLRRRIYDVMRKHLEDDNSVDLEVRGRLKHLQEGTPAWEIEYQKVLHEVRKKRGAA